MRSPALALGWELFAHHRYGLAVVGGGAVVAAVAIQLVPLGSASQAVAEAAYGLSFFAYLYLMSVFIYGENTFSGTVAGFPPRLFTLPVRTCWLVAWPMLYGTAAAALLWMWLTILVLIPSGLTHTVVWWPALLAAALLASFQAISWTLVATPLMRLAVAICGLPGIVLGTVMFCVNRNIEATRDQAVIGLCAVIGVSYGAAVIGVARDRRGDRLSWAGLLGGLRGAVPHLPTRNAPFSSPFAAQRWLEVRRTAWLLPTFTGLFVAMLFWAAVLPLSPQEVARVAAAVAAVPALLGFFVGFGMGKMSFWAKELQLSTFTVARPLSSAALARAKLVAAGWSVLAAWSLIFVLAIPWASASGNGEAVRDLAATVFRGLPDLEIGLLALLIAVGLAGMTWLHMVGGMCLSLSGRPTAVNGVTLLYLTVGTALASLVAWTVHHPDFFGTLLDILWGIGGSLALLKLAAAAWLFTRPSMLQQRLAPTLATWSAVAICLLVPLYVLVPHNPVSTHLVALYLLLSLPFSRLAALPAALSWNRHR